jgi:hypothetical protein
MLSYVARASLQLPEGTSGEGTKTWEEKDGRGGIEGEGKEWSAEGRKNDSKCVAINMS